MVHYAGFILAVYCQIIRYIFIGKNKVKSIEHH